MKKIRFTVDERFYRNKRGEKCMSYVTRLVQAEKIDGDSFLYKVARKTSIPDQKILYILAEIQDLVISSVMDGHPVEVPNIGTFRIGLRSDAKVRRQDAGTKAMKALVLNFQPALKIKKRLSFQNAEFLEVKK